MVYGVSVSAFFFHTGSSVFAGVRVRAPPPQKKRYDHRCDVWSLGILALELAEGQAPLYRTPGAKSLIQRLESSSPPPKLLREEAWSMGFRDFLLRVLTKDYMLRPYIDEILQHPFITSVDEADARAAVRASPHFGQTMKLEAALEPIRNVNRSEVDFSAGVELSDEANQSAEDWDDLALSTELTEIAILTKLKQRFDLNIVYTYIGDILLVSVFATWLCSAICVRCTRFNLTLTLFIF